MDKTDDKHYRVVLDSSLTGIALTSEGTDKPMKEVQQTMTEAKTIAELEKVTSMITKDYEEKVKTLEEKLEQMKATEAAMKTKFNRMEQKEQEIKEQVERIEGKANTTNLMYGNMKLKLAQKDEDVEHYKIKFEKAFHLYQKANNETTKLKSAENDDTIEYWKQKFEEANRLSHERTAKLEAELQTTIQNHVRELEDYKEIVFGLQAQLGDSTLKFNKRIKALENEIADLKEPNDDMEVTGENIPDNFVKLKDVIVGTEVNYEKLIGKVLILKSPFENVNNGNIRAYHNDGDERKLIEIVLNGSFKLHITGEFYCANGRPLSKFLLDNIHSCSLEALRIRLSEIFIKDYVKLVKSRTIENLCLNTVTVYDRNNKDVPLERMLEYFPNLKVLTIWCKHNNPLHYTTNCTTKTSQNLLKIPFENLEKFSLFGCPYGFDLRIFGHFIEKHPMTQFRIQILAQNCPQRRYNYLHFLKHETFKKYSNCRIILNGKDEEAKDEQQEEEEEYA